MVKLGSTIRIRNKIYDFDGVTPLTPDSQEVKIYDAEGILKETITDPTLESEGVYYVDFNIENSPDGNWKVVWKVTKGTKSDVETKTFLVEAP